MFVQKQNVNIVNILWPQTSNWKLFKINKDNVKDKNNKEDSFLFQLKVILIEQNS